MIDLLNRKLFLKKKLEIVNLFYNTNKIKKKKKKREFV